jgi:hypothetical protein
MNNIFKVLSLFVLAPAAPMQAAAQAPSAPVQVVSAPPPAPAPTAPVPSTSQPQQSATPNASEMQFINGLNQVFVSTPPGPTPAKKRFETEWQAKPVSDWTCKVLKQENWTTQGGFYCGVDNPAFASISFLVYLSPEQSDRLGVVSRGALYKFSGAIQSISPSYKGPFDKKADSVTVSVKPSTVVSLSASPPDPSNDGATDIPNGKLLGYTLGDVYKGTFNPLNESEGYSSRQFMRADLVPKAQLVHAVAPNGLGEMYFLVTPKSKRIIKIAILKSQFRDKVGYIDPKISNDFALMLLKDYGAPNSVQAAQKYFDEMPKPDMSYMKQMASQAQSQSMGGGASENFGRGGSFNSEGKCSVLIKGLRHPDNPTPLYLASRVGCGKLDSNNDYPIEMLSVNTPGVFRVSMPDATFSSQAGKKMMSVYNSDQ